MGRTNLGQDDNDLSLGHLVSLVGRLKQLLQPRTSATEGVPGVDHLEPDVGLLERGLKCRQVRVKEQRRRRVLPNSLGLGGCLEDPLSSNERHAGLSDRLGVLVVRVVLGLLDPLALVGSLEGGSVLLELATLVGDLGQDLVLVREVVGNSGVDTLV